MSAGLSLVGALTPQMPSTEPAQAVPSTVGERVESAWEGAQTADRYWNQRLARQSRAQKIIDDYQGLTGEELLNPYGDRVTLQEQQDNPGMGAAGIMAKRLDTLRAKTAAARQNLPELGGLPQDFLDVDSIDRDIARQSVAARTQEGQLVGTGNGIPAFAASAAGEMLSPHGVATMFLPVTRLPAAGAEAIGGSFLANVAKEAGVQALGQMGVQIPAEIADTIARQPLGTAPTLEESLANVAAAGAGGALFGALFRGAHLQIRKLAGRGLEEGVSRETPAIPPAVKDAAIAMESRELYGDKNAVGIPTAAHEQAFDKAVQDVALGRPADVSGIVQNIQAGGERLNPESPVDRLEGGPLTEPSMPARAASPEPSPELKAQAEKTVQLAGEPVESPALRQPKMEAPVEGEGAGRPAVTGETPQDRVIAKHVADLTGEGGTATPEQKRAYALADQAEKEAQTAIGCVQGAIA